MDASNVHGVERGGALTLAKCGDETEEVYTPVNFISDEVFALIAAWESTNLTSKASSDPTDIEKASLAVSQDTFEPHRRYVASPKRFYRKFWSSLSRRILISSTMKTT